MSRGKRRTHDEFISEIKEINPNIEILNTFTTVNDSIKCKCKIDGYVWSTSASNLLYSHHGCPRCANTLKRTHEEFVEIMSRINPNVEILGHYKTALTPIKCKCKLDGYVWFPKPHNLYNKTGCPRCNKSERYTHEKFIDIIKDKLPNVKIISSYSCMKSRIQCECLIDEYTWSPLASQLMKGVGCPVCANKVIIRGVNDIATTHPSVAELLANADDGYKYSFGSQQKVDWKCPTCGSLIKQRAIHSIIKKGLSCSQCSDGLSYPNKLMFNILVQLGVEPITEYAPEWAFRKRYDFYFVKNNKQYIVEMDDGFHYHDSVSRNIYASKMQINDAFKDELALLHGIEVIRINCDIAKLDYIQKNINDSELANIFDISIVNWELCNKFALTSQKIEACNLWTKYHDMHVIATELHVSHGAVYNWISAGSKYGLCDYNPQNEYILAKERTRKSMLKPVQCIETGESFSSITEALQYLGYRKRSAILTDHLLGRRSYAGFLVDGTKLHWKYVN